MLLAAWWVSDIVTGVSTDVGWDLYRIGGCALVATIIGNEDWDDHGPWFGPAPTHQTGRHAAPAELKGKRRPMKRAYVVGTILVIAAPAAYWLVLTLIDLIIPA